MPVAPRRLNDAQREEVRTRVLAGERQVDLAREFGVTRAYVSLIRQQALHPERYQEPRRELKIKLLSRELEELLKVVAATRPIDHGLEPPMVRWDEDLVGQLGRKMFGKRLVKRVVRQALDASKEARAPGRVLRRPQPPEKHHIGQLSRDLLDHEEFVEYYLSPAAEQVEWRSYERALAEWIARHGDVEEVSLGTVLDEDGVGSDDWDSTPVFEDGHRVPPGPGKRTGKHAGSKARTTDRKKKRRGKKR